MMAMYKCQIYQRRAYIHIVKLHLVGFRRMTDTIQRKRPTTNLRNVFATPLLFILTNFHIVIIRNGNLDTQKTWLYFSIGKYLT